MSAYLHNQNPGRRKRKRKQRPFFTVSIVAKDEKEKWRAFIQTASDPNEQLPAKYTFSLIKALGLLQQDQIRNGEKVGMEYQMYAYTWHIECNIYHDVCINARR